jgi:hypothetical protein
MQIERTNKQIIITIPDDDSYFSYSELEVFLNYIKFKSHLERKQGDQKVADQLADEADQNWWANNKDRILKQG